MAIVNAVKSGNWSDPTVWSGGSVPVNGDTVSAVDFIVELDVDFSQPLTTLTSTSGRFRYSGTGTRTVTANANLATHTATGLIENQSTGHLIFLGEVQGGTGSSAFGAVNQSTGILSVTTAKGHPFTGGGFTNADGARNVGAGTINVENAVGGARHVGVSNTSSGTANIVSAIGGTPGQSTFNNHGFLNHSTGTAYVGTATGGNGIGSPGAGNIGAGLLICDLAIGNDYGPGSIVSNANPGVSGGNTLGAITRVRAIQSGPFGQAAIAGSVLLDPQPTNTAQFRTVLNGAIKTLADPATFADSPIPADVRAGVAYNYGNNIGTCAVPTPNQVSAGTAVDAAVGTAVITEDQLYAVLQRNPAFTAERTLGDDKPLTFSWPNSTDTIQGEVSLDNGPYVPITGNISYLRNENGKYYYILEYNPADRPTEEGTARYRLYSNTHTMYATLRTIEDFEPILERLPEELDEGRMKAIISDVQETSIQSGIVQQLKKYEVS